jgi:hypothetical protein
VNRNHFEIHLCALQVLVLESFLFSFIQFTVHVKAVIFIISKTRRTSTVVAEAHGETAITTATTTAAAAATTTTNVSVAQVDRRAEAKDQCNI